MPEEATPHAAIPPIIDPKGHEAFPTFRETFLVYFTDPTANAAAYSTPGGSGPSTRRGSSGQSCGPSSRISAALKAHS
jgi:hypothetical protein